MRIFNKEIDPYEAFFISGGVVVMSLLLAVVSALIEKSPNGIYMYPLATLVAVVIMFNMGGNNVITAKQTFWIWIGATVGFAVWAYFGRFLIWSFT